VWWRSCGTNCVADPTSTLACVRRDPESELYRSSFLLGAFFVTKKAKHSASVRACPVETASGMLVHRVIEGQASDTTDCLVDL
jgi:hypothetical protein